MTSKSIIGFTVLLALACQPGDKLRQPVSEKFRQPVNVAWISFDLEFDQSYPFIDQPTDYAKKTCVKESASGERYSECIVAARLERLIGNDYLSLLSVEYRGIAKIDPKTGKPSASWEFDGSQCQAAGATDEQGADDARYQLAKLFDDGHIRMRGSATLQMHIDPFNPTQQFALAGHGIYRALFRGWTLVLGTFEVDDEPIYSFGDLRQRFAKFSACVENPPSECKNECTANELDREMCGWRCCTAPYLDVFVRQDISIFPAPQTWACSWPAGLRKSVALLDEMGQRERIQYRIYLKEMREGVFRVDYDHGQLIMDEEGVPVGCMRAESSHPEFNMIDTSRLNWIIDYDEGKGKAKPNPTPTPTTRDPEFIPEDLKVQQLCANFEIPG